MRDVQDILDTFLDRSLRVLNGIEHVVLHWSKILQHLVSYLFSRKEYSCSATAIYRFDFGLVLFFVNL